MKSSQTLTITMKYVCLPPALEQFSATQIIYGENVQGGAYIDASNIVVGLSPVLPILTADCISQADNA